MNTYCKLTLLSLAVSSFCNNSVAGTQVFLVTPNISAQTSLINGQTGSAVYQITNNTHFALNNIALYMPGGGVIADTGSVSANSQYCANPFNLSAGSSCLLKVDLNSAKLGSGLSGGPVVCYSQSQPVYCSQPFQVDQMQTSISQGAIPQDCNSNIANFNYELLQSFDSASSFTTGWGPARNVLSLSPSNPNLTNCPTTAGTSWQQARVIAAASFWISQKLNYCHHYNPDYATPLSQRGASGSSGGYCNPALDTMPGSVYYNQQARWNYTGQGSETANNWVNNNQMWYGMDCSNTTSFIYNFSLGIQFDSKTSSQGGQESCGSTTCPQDSLSPNQQNTGSFTGQYLDNPNRAGYLVCLDGTIDANSGPGSSGTPTLCAGHGGYLSSINSSGRFDQPRMTIDTLVPNGTPILNPGDLLYIAGAGPDPQPNPDGSNSEVTHVIMWIGKQVGYGPNDINPALVAPDDSPCADPSIWQPQVGDWLIADSHYQGYDYRVLTQCFYLNDLWGVRRVIT